VQLWPRRSKCRDCSVTHVLLPDCSLARRRDDVEVVGEALRAKAAGQGHRRTAEGLGLPASTVRGWQRAFCRAAEVIRAHFTRWAAALDPLLGALEPAGSAVSDALAAVGTAASAAVRRLGEVRPWRFAARATGGGLLCNTSCPFWPSP
jgi:hypothetical protein